MKENFDINVANDVATIGVRRKYASPEIEVVNLDEQPKLLSASVGTRGLTNGEEWSDDEE
jgi:hypothetical protein